MNREALVRYLLPGSGPLDFIGEQCRLADGRCAGETWDRDPWIRDGLLSPVFARGEDGLPVHKLVYAELARGHWKSGAGGAVALAEAVLHKSTDVVVAAADRDQAAIIGENVEGYLERNPSLRRSVKQTEGLWEVPSRGSRIRIISSDARTAWGLGGTHRRFRFLADELTVWAKPDLWEAVVSATGKVADAQTVVFSNAGFDMDHSWQWKIRETAEREAWGHLFTTPGVIASWVTDGWVEQMRGLLPGPAFDRVILNLWTTAEGDFVTLEQYRRCVEANLARHDRGEAGRDYVGAVDLGLTKDRTALVVLHRDGHGVPCLDDLKVWQGTRARPVSIVAIEDEIISASRRYPGISFVVDPWQMKGSIERLRRAGVRIREFVFSAASVGRLSQVLYQTITTARVRLYPDAELEREIVGLRVVQNAGGWRVDHKAGGFSDRAMALAMALSELPKRGNAGSFSGVSDGFTVPAIEFDGVVLRGEKYLDRSESGALVAPSSGWKVTRAIDPELKHLLGDWRA